MGDTSNRRPVEGRPPHSPGARLSEGSARPPFSSSAETERGETPGVPGPRRGRAWRAENGPDPATLRRLAQLLLVRGEHLGREGGFLEAGFHFESAATIFEGLEDPIPAAEAALEVGRCTLLCGQGELLKRLAGRIDNLASEHAASLPVGGNVGLRVWAQILRKAERDPCALFGLIDERRRERRRVRRASIDSLWLLAISPEGEPS